jgi:hypothetical protein
MLETLLRISEDVEKALAPFADITDDVWRSSPDEPNRILRQDESAVAVALGEHDIANKNGAMIAQLPAAVQNLRAISDRLKVEIAELGPLRGKLTPDTKISGKRFEEFYRNTFPAGWVLEDLPYEASDDRDVWVMHPTREEAFAWFGYAERNGDPTPNAGPRLAALERATKKRETVELSELYEAVYADLRAANEAQIPDVSITTQLEDWRSGDAIDSDDAPVGPSLPVTVKSNGVAVDVALGGSEADPYGKQASSVRIEREGDVTRVMVYDSQCDAPRVLGVPDGKSMINLPDDWEPVAVDGPEVEV